VRTDSNIELVNDLICSQEGQPGTSMSPREIVRENFTIFSCENCQDWFAAQSVSTKFSRWQQQTNWNNWMHASVWRNVWLI